MKNVKVLLRENVDGLGLVGDLVNVAPGYARNFLIPRRVAIAATPENVRSMERRRERYEAGLAAVEARIEERIAALGRLRLSTAERADETGTLYGSVNAQAVVRLLAEKGYEIDEDDVRLDEPIKSVGAHEVPIHVHGEHYASIELVVEASH